MASKEEWCVDKITKLMNEDLRISTLNEIKQHFQEISNVEAAETAELLELPLVFDCLNDSNKEQVDLACEVLSLCMERLDIGETTTRYNIPLERALTHPNAGVKLMALEALAKIMKCEASRKHQLVNDLSKRPLFANTIRCIGDADLIVASLASQIVLHFGTDDVECLLTPQLLGIIKETMLINEVVRLRFYELFINICVANQSSHNKILATGLLQPMLNEISSNDILLRLNIIEMMYKLVECDYGYDYLFKQGFIDGLFKQFAQETDPIAVQLCEPGILKFFGHMAHCKPNVVFTQYQQVAEQIFNNLESSDYTSFKVSLETLGYISRADKNVLDSYGDKMLKAIKTIAERLQILPTKEKVLVLSWIEELLKNPSDENASNICFKWYSTFGSNPMELIMHYVRNPFEELRLAGLGVLSSLTMHRWGHEAMASYPGLIEFMLDRNAETFKAAKDAKFNIIEAIYNSNMNVFNNAVITQFGNYVQEGPYYVCAVTEVAIESNQ